MQYDPAIADRVLNLLRQWGWEAGLQRLRVEIDSNPSDGKQTELQLFLGWMAAERGAYEEAVAQFLQLEQVAALAGWAALGQAFVAFRRKDFAGAHQLLDRAASRADVSDLSLRGTIALTRGSMLFHQGKTELSLPLLHEALELFGPEKFSAGRVLDALGMVYAGRDNIHAAREFYLRAIEHKRGFQDDAGLALSHGQLGRLYLDWSQFDRAEEEFKEDLAICRRIHDLHGEAQLNTHLGQVALAKKDLESAAAYLDLSIRLSRERGLVVSEGYAHKDRALVHLAAGEITEAEEQVLLAEPLFQRAEFAEGLAHANRTRGLLFRVQGRHQESEQCLRRALEHFESREERAEAARTQLEIARTLRAGVNPRPVVREALLTALASAEASNRDALVLEVETDLRTLDEAAYWRHAFRRVRGHAVREDLTSLITGTRETITVLFLDLKGSTDYARLTDPETVLLTLNQLMAELAGVLRPFNVQINQYLGDGFMALARGADHARRGVAAALQLQVALAEFNRPRRVLQLRAFEARVGVSTGEVFLGNVGTYAKMDYTAIAAVVNLAARLQTEAEPAWPCISRETYDRVKERFVFHERCPRTVQPKGIGACEVWDVVSALP